MIFVPSINGISHNPAERTNINNDLAEGPKPGINARINLPRKNKEPSMGYLNNVTGYRDDLLANRAYQKHGNYAPLTPDGLVKILFRI